MIRMGSDAKLSNIYVATDNVDTKEEERLDLIARDIVEHWGKRREAMFGKAMIDTAIAQLVNEAVTADEVVDIYKLAGVDTPELSILSDEFLDSLAHRDKPNLQMGLLRRILSDQIKTVQRTNVVQGRRFSELLDEAVNRYTNRSLTTAEIISELVKLAKDMRDQTNRHERLGLSEAEALLLSPHQAAPSVASGGRIYSGNGDTNFGTITVKANSTLRWTCRCDPTTVPSPFLSYDSSDLGSAGSLPTPWPE
jgi:type I site-specific restriction-modification system R (restriction) subunit